MTEYYRFFVKSVPPPSIYQFSYTVALWTYIFVKLGIRKVYLLQTCFLPLLHQISDTVIEDRFGVQQGTAEWYEALDQHFKWLLQYRISPYFCKWADGMRVLTYTSPWPGIFMRQ